MIGKTMKAEEVIVEVTIKVMGEKKTEKEVIERVQTGSRIAWKRVNKRQGTSEVRI